MFKMSYTYHNGFGKSHLSQWWTTHIFLTIYIGGVSQNNGNWSILTIFDIFCRICYFLVWGLRWGHLTAWPIVNLGNVKNYCFHKQLCLFRVLQIDLSFFRRKWWFLRKKALAGTLTRKNKVVDTKMIEHLHHKFEQKSC